MGLPMASNDVSTEVAGAVVGSKRKAEEVVADRGRRARCRR
jgi:hypothetical protein